MSEQMSMMTFSDETSAKAYKGFRLDRIELRNFGGYHSGGDLSQIAEFNFRNGHGVFTGEIGAGKSTVIDAMRLLYRARPRFNSATDAKSKDRDVRSYALGYFANEGSWNEAPVRLRHPDDRKQSSAILAVFRAADGRCFTVCRMFMVKGEAGDLEYHNFTFPDVDVSLRSDLKVYETQGKMARLAKELGGERHARNDDFFMSFGRLLGFEGDRYVPAFQLIEEAISANRMGSVADFARRFILPEFDFASRTHKVIEAAKETAKARRKIKSLRLIVENAEKVLKGIAQLEDAEDKIGDALRARQTLPIVKSYVQFKGLDALSKVEEGKKHVLDAQKKDLESRMSDLQTEFDSIKAALFAADNGRTGELEAEIAGSLKEIERREATRARIHGHLSDLSIKTPTEADAWDALVDRVGAEREDNAARRRSQQEARDSAALDLSKLTDKKRRLSAELSDLEKHGSIIPGKMIEARDTIAEEAGLSKDALPFLGEILRIRPGEEEWELAAGRVLGNAAIDILVSPEHYAEVTAIQASRNWGCRVAISREGRQSDAPLGADALARKLEVQPASPLYDQANAIIARIAGHRCVSEAEYGAAKGNVVTRGGAVKTGDRSVKDDGVKNTARIGWSVEARAEELRKEIKEIDLDIADSNNMLSQYDAGLQVFAKKDSAMDAFVRDYVVFDHIRIDGLEAQVASARKSLEALQTGEIADLKTRQKSVGDELKTSQEELDRLKDRISRLAGLLSIYTRDRQVFWVKLTEATEANGFFPRKEARRVLTEISISEDLEAETPAQKAAAIGILMEDRAIGKTELFDKLLADLEKNTGDVTKKLEKSKNELSKATNDFFNAHPELRSENITCEITESDALAVRGRDAWKAFYGEKKNNELLGFEDAFREEEAVRWGDAVKEFKKDIENYNDTIRYLKGEVNDILVSVPYDPIRGTRAQIMIKRDKSAILKEFDSAMDAAIAEINEGMPGDSVDQLMRFLEESDSKTLEERRTYLIDFRNHWVTSVEEYLWEDGDLGMMVNRHDSAGSASGGQGERLTLLLLGAGLSYTFGRYSPEQADRALGMIVLDEAFAKSSPDGARAAAGVLKAMNLQMIIATPLTHVGVLGGDTSRIFNVTKYAEQATVKPLGIADIKRLSAA